MKKLILAVVLVVAVAAGQAYAAPGVYKAGAATMALEVGGTCETRTISLDGTGMEASNLVSGGFQINIDDPSQVSASIVGCYETGGLSPAVWDAGSVITLPPPAGEYSVAQANLGLGVPVSSNILCCDVQFCGTALGDTTATITIDTITGFDTWVNGNVTNYDPTTDAFVINVDLSVPPCTCSITGPATIEADALAPVTEQYTANPGPACVEPPVYAYAIACAGTSAATINPTTGLVTVPPYLGPGNDVCTITVTDTANTDANTGDPVVCDIEVTIEPGSTCSIEIALGRACPGEAIDDPAYNRPGRRGLAATCNEDVDFTVCSDNPDFAPECLTWTVTKPAGGVTIAPPVKIDDCCWRLNTGDTCDQLDKIATYTVTVTDSCCQSSDSVELEIGKVIVSLGDTNLQPNSESGTVDIDLINPEHAIRAISMDIAECDTAVNADNLVCTQCIIDPNRALEFTCSANEQADGSCRVVLYATDPSAIILQAGRTDYTTIAQIVYSAQGELEVCGEGACIDLCPINITISDQFNEELCACSEAGEVCFVTCGDIYPQDCIGGTCGANTCCGDGVIDLFDILEAVDIVLRLQNPTCCQLANGDVPNGMPPYCGDPAGTPNCENTRANDGLGACVEDDPETPANEIAPFIDRLDIMDLVVMIDKALGRMNCCDYCQFGKIF